MTPGPYFLKVLVTLHLSMAHLLRFDSNETFLDLTCIQFQLKISKGMNNFATRMVVYYGQGAVSLEMVGLATANKTASWPAFVL